MPCHQGGGCADIHSSTSSLTFQNNVWDFWVDLVHVPCSNTVLLHQHLDVWLTVIGCKRHPSPLYQRLWLHVYEKDIHIENIPKFRGKQQAVSLNSVGQESDNIHFKWCPPYTYQIVASQNSCPKLPQKWDLPLKIRQFLRTFGYTWTSFPLLCIWTPSETWKQKIQGYKWRGNPSSTSRMGINGALN